MRHKLWLAALALLLAAGAVSCLKDTATPSVPQSAEQVAVRPTAVAVALQAGDVGTAADASGTQVAAATTATFGPQPTETVTATPAPQATEAATEQPAAPPLLGPAPVATVRALATQEASAPTDKLLRDALGAVGLKVGFGDVSVQMQPDGYRVLVINLRHVPAAQVEASGRQAMLAAGTIAAAGAKSWDRIVVDVVDQKTQKTALILAADREDVEDWRARRSNDDEFLAATLTKGRQMLAVIEAANAVPAPLPTRESVATPNPSAVTITLADLPLEFHEPSPAELAAIQNPFGLLATVQTRFVFDTPVSSKGYQAVSGVCAAITNDANWTAIDAALAEPLAWLDSAVAAQKAQAGVTGVTEKKVLGGLGMLGDRNAGLKIVYTLEDGPAMELDMIAFRRGNTVCQINTVYPAQVDSLSPRPFVSIADLARKLDDRCIEFQKNLVPHAGGQAGEEKAFS